MYDINETIAHILVCIIVGFFIMQMAIQFTRQDWTFVWIDASFVIFFLRGALK